MSNEKKIMQEGKPQKYRLKMTFAIIILAALFIVELYFMLNNSDNYLVLGIIGLVMLCFVYWITDLSFKIHNERDARMDKEFERVYKAAKVSYMFLRRSVLELSDKLEEIDDNSSMPIDELIDAQKAIAKVTINRSKENANALMNSNDKLIERMLSFESKLQELIENTHTESNEAEFEKVSHSIEENQHELLSLMHEVENSLKEDLLKASDALETKMSSIPDSVASLVPEPQIIEKTIVQEKVVAATETAPVMEQEPVVEEVPVMEEAPAADPNATMSMEEIEKLLQEANVLVDEPADGESAVEEQDVEELVMETPIIEEPEEAEPVMEEPIIEEPEEAKPVMEEPMIKEPMIKEPVAADPNHIMTPDEIAALLGDIGGADTKEPEPEPVVEEKPPMPDLSDPGHVMTPEEIAALLANM